ncbi:ABC transporter substrate-binding protein [Agromyces silvae]|uniref:ABC transporter substrate-binding protein n=1 Tax=Agromyces silvae TaxID=3388266 RepID=UPI00280ADEFC|nr:extracellular solute-binding protein [Agromyces protaetiae]
MHTTDHAIRSRTRFAAALGLSAALLLTGCDAPGGVAPTRSTPAVSTELGSDPVRITARVNEDQVALWESLTEAFEVEFPTVTVELETEAFDTLQQNAPRYLAAEHTPDLLRLAAPGDAVKNGLLLTLDPYAEAYGWDDFPRSQLEQWTIAEDGRVRGEGALYGMGAGFGLVGVYYDRDRLEELGYTSPPSTLDEFEGMLATAAQHGTTPLMGNPAYLFQGLTQAYGGADAVSDWVFNVPGATIETPEAETAARTLQEWIAAGYFPRDFGSADPGLDFGRFSDGESLFFHNGSWFAAGLDTVDPGRFGFFLLPPAEPPTGFQTMAAPNALVIPSGAEHPNEAAAFLNWLNGDEARAILAEVGGLAAGGPADLSPPPVPTGTVFADTIAAFDQVVEADGIVDFLANATAGMSSATLDPQSDLLIAGHVTAEEFLANLQADYAAATSARGR